MNEQTLRAAVIIAATDIPYNDESTVSKFFWMNRFKSLVALKAGIIFLITGAIFSAIFFLTV